MSDRVDKELRQPALPVIGGAGDDWDDDDRDRDWKQDDDRKKDDDRKQDRKRRRKDCRVELANLCGLIQVFSVKKGCWSTLDRDHCWS